MHSLFKSLQNGLIVSCQAEGDSPFNNPTDVAKFAITAKMGGAHGIRTEGFDKALAVLKAVDMPVIGLIKSAFEDGYVRITGKESDVVSLLDAGCHIIALDGTFRIREQKTGPEFIRYLKQKYNAVIMADIATRREAEACFEAGADCISTTLNGYTPETSDKKSTEPDLEFLSELTIVLKNKIPVFAEGRFNTPQLAAKAIEIGAWAVVTGTAITRPQVITKWFYDAIKKRI